MTNILNSELEFYSREVRHIEISKYRWVIMVTDINLGETVARKGQSLRRN